MGAAKKQVMDVSKPGKSAASATARPLIVGHGVSVQDPMMVPAANSSPAPTPPDVSVPADDAEPLQARHGETVLAPLTRDEPGQVGSLTEQRLTPLPSDTRPLPTMTPSDQVLGRSTETS